MLFHFALRRADARLSALFFYVAYTVAATVAVWLITGAGDSLSTLGFGFGPKIALVAAGEPLGDATDLPFVPYFLGLLARFWDDPLFVALVKNLVFQALPAYVFVRLWSCAARGWLTPALLVYVLTFPQLVRHGFALIPEEAYLIPVFAFVFWGLVEARPGWPWWRLVPYALVSALSFLIKDGALLVGPAVALAYGIKTRSYWILGLFLGLLAVAVAGVGFVNLANTGQFSATGSLSGYDFWKGNNVHTLDHFPFRTLDAISHLAPPREAGQTEWAWSRMCLDEGVRFNLEHPGQALHILGLRFYQVFLAVTGEASPSDFAGREALKLVGVAYMVVFRVLLLLAIVHAVLVLWRGAKAAGLAGLRSGGGELALGYLLFTAAFVAPYLVAWGTERRLMPLIIPTCLYVWSVARGRAQRPA